MGLFGKVLRGVENDAKGLVDPRNYYRAGKMAVTHPIGFGKSVGKSYLDLAEHPIRNLENHPLNSVLAVAPIGGGLGKLASLGKLSEEAATASRLARFGDKNGVGYLNEAIKRPNVLAGAIKRAQGERLLEAEPEASGMTKAAVTQGYREPQSYGIAGMGAPGPHVPPTGDFRVGTQIFRNPNDARFGLDINDMKTRPYNPKDAPVNEGPASRADVLARSFFTPTPPLPKYGESFSDAPVWTPPWDVDSASQSLERGSVGPFHPPKEDILDNRAIPRDRALQLLKQLMEERQRGADGYTGGRRRYNNGFGNMN